MGNTFVKERTCGAFKTQTNLKAVCFSMLIHHYHITVLRSPRNIAFSSLLKQVFDIKLLTVAFGFFF